METNSQYIEKNDSSDDYKINLSNFTIHQRLEYKNYFFYLIQNIVNSSKKIAKCYKYPYDKNSFKQAIYVNSKLNHPSILKFVGYNLTNFENKPYPVLVTEYFDHTSHLHSIEKEFDDECFVSIKGNDTQKLITIYGIAAGMSYLHSNNILHRYLQADNIVYDGSFYPKITGFEYSIEIPPNCSQTEPIQEFVYKGTPRYLSPEIMINYAYSKSSDVYAFGILMLEIMCSQKYFRSSNPLFSSSQTQFVPAYIDEPYGSLIKRCLSEDPKLRPTFDEIVTEIRMNPKFITKKVDANDFNKYVEFIDKSPAIFDSAKKKIQIEDIEKQIHSESPIVYLYQQMEKELNNSDIKADLHLIKQKDEESDEENNFFIYQKNSKEGYNILEIYPKDIFEFGKHEIINFSRKINIMSQLKHPAINRFIRYYPFKFDDKQKPVIETDYYLTNLYNFIILELCNESFFSNLEEIQFPELLQTQKLIILYGICSGMSYLHSHNILHRDLKPTNILLFECTNTEGLKLFYPKITGFDIAKEISNDKHEKSQKIKGTPAYLAPEIYLNHDYSKASDVYSFAYIMYELLTYNKPIIGENAMQVKTLREQGIGVFTCLDKINKELRKLLLKCLSYKPELRPTFDEIMTEFRTNSKIFQGGIYKDLYFEYIDYLSKFPDLFYPSKRIKQFDELISSKIQTFHEIEAQPNLFCIYQTEKNDLSFEHNFDIEKYEFVKSTGNGMFYDTSIIRNKTTKEKLIMKSIHSYNSFIYISQSEFINFYREMLIRSQIKHPAIFDFIAYVQNNKTDCGVIENIRVESLNHFIEKCKESKTKDETQNLIIIYGIASAMSYLHSHDILHRDLKPANVFLDEALNPKLSGFNIAKKIGEKSGKIKGTPAYIAPEIYLNQEYSKASDIYAFSFIIYEIFTLNKPFEINQSPIQIKREVVEKGYRPQFNVQINETYRELIEKCWSQNPSSRPTFDEIINELRTNSRYITENINKNKYYQYIQLIDESQITFMPTMETRFIKSNLKSKWFYFSNKQTKFCLRNIYETEYNNLPLENEITNINEFEKKNLIDINVFKCYKIIHKQDKKIYFAQKLLYSKKSFFDMINYVSLNHPSITKFIGYSQLDFKNRQRPIIISEYGINGSLNKILDIDIIHKEKSLIDDTSRLIILYGIASGMSYLHSQNILYKNLKASSIVLDDFLFPKIKGFQNLVEMPNKPIEFYFMDKEYYFFYTDGEINSPEFYKLKESNVFSFATIAYLLMYNDIPFSENEHLHVKLKKGEGVRTIFNDSVPKCYQKLIEQCWSYYPNERPTFDEIVNLLKSNNEFIYDKINQKKYFMYISLIDEYQENNNCMQIDENIFQKTQIDLKKIRESFGDSLFADTGSIDLKNFRKGEKIGSGGFGSVYKVYENGSNTLYAAKISNREISNEAAIIDIAREINIISQLNHPSILKYIGYSKNNFKGLARPVIVTEFAPNKTLRDILDLEENGFGIHDWNDTKKLITIYGIASGISYLHKRNIIHRDIKPANILFDNHLFPKIADFGLSKILSDEYLCFLSMIISWKSRIEKMKQNSITVSSFKGTYAYSSPQVLKTGIYTKKDDIYAFGMTIYEIVTNKKPFKDINLYQFLFQIQNNIYPKIGKDVPECYRDLISDCWFGNFKDAEKIVYLLETKNDFITPNVDKEEYYNYISFIKEEINANYQSANNKFLLFNNVLFDNENDLSKIEFIDLSQYIKMDEICKDETKILYKIREKCSQHIYCAQISMFMIKRIQKEEIEKLGKFLEKIKKLNHPSLMKFIGYSPINFKNERKPVIITENGINYSLEDILQFKRKNISSTILDDTKKLIIIYGISSCMEYLHSNDVVMQSLNSSSVYLNDLLQPKLSDFGLSTHFSSFDEETFYTISSKFKSLVYSSPEALKSNEHYKSGDVYSFGMIVYEIMCDKFPFEEIENIKELFDEVIKKEKRPNIDSNIQRCYRLLIEECWSQDPNKRPTFHEIVHRLRTDNEFITEKVNKQSYQEYINFIETHTKEKHLQIKEHLQINESKVDEN